MCDAPFGRQDLADGFPHGSRLAYDPLRGRLWAICDACHRWTLAAAESRLSVIAALERLLRDGGRVLARTAHVALYEAPPLTVLRVERAGSAEEAWWRYGREQQQRHERARSRGARWSAYGLLAVARAGEALGLEGLELDPARSDSAIAGVLRRRFGSTAWEGRLTCPYCRSVLLSMPFDFTWWLLPRMGPHGLEVGVPCTRCDPWTPENAYRLDGEEAHRVLRRALAYQNVAGASDRHVAKATSAIAIAGSPAALIARLSTGRTSLWSIGKQGVLAFEIALSERLESEQLQAEVRELEAAWRMEAELAEIIDRELAGP